MAKEKYSGVLTRFSCFVSVEGGMALVVAVEADAAHVFPSILYVVPSSHRSVSEIRSSNRNGIKRNVFPASKPIAHTNSTD